VIGQAKAESEKLLQLAPVEAQIVLAKEIGENEGYQKYLITIRQVEASQSVGLAQAGALEKADVKVIANTGAGQDAGSGLSSIGDLFSSKGGLGLGAALEALSNTDAGKAILNKMTGKEIAGTA
jgi:flotillin